MNENNILSYVRLKFTIDTPMIEEIWLEGYEFAQKQLDDSANPYQQDDPLHHYWNEGWWAGFYGEEPLFTLDGPCLATVVSQPSYESTSMYVNSSSPLRDFFLMVAENKFLITLYKLSTALIASFMVYELIGTMT